MKSDLGADLHACDVCGTVTVLRFGVCKRCDDAFWLTQMSKKQMDHTDHTLEDIKHIKKCMKKSREV